jgi:hypothetical protein
VLLEGPTGHPPRPFRLRIAVCLAAAALALPPAGARASTPPPEAAPPDPIAAAAAAAAEPVNAVGYELDLGALPSPHPRPQPPPDSSATAPLWMRLTVPWSLVEKTAGQYDWSLCDQIVQGHAGAGFRVVLAPRAENPLHPAGDEEESAWTAFLREMAARYQREVAHFLLDAAPRPLQELEAKEAAYWLKVSSVAIKASHPSARIALGDLDAARADAPAFLEGLYAEGIAVYLDAVAGRTDSGDDLLRLRQPMLLHDPSAALWWTGRTVPGGAASGGRLLRAYLAALARETALTSFRLDAGPDGMPVLLGVLDRIRSTVTPAHSPLVESGRGVQLLTPMGQPVQATVVRLFDPEDKSVLIGYDAGEGAARGAQAVMVVDSLDVAEPLLKDVAAGEQAPAGAYQKDEAGGVTRLAVPLADYPLVLRYKRFTTPLFAEEERLQVTETRLPSVEEIIARHQAFQAAQDALLLNWRADARLDYRFRIGGGSTVDVTILNAFYFDPRVGPEFEQKEFFVNGVKWRSNRIPEFPLPQPEKVLTLPLDISLDTRYAYRLDGEETVDGYDCWVVSFEPVAEEGSLYKGRIWIDKKTGARVQVSSLQTGLQPPITSNDQKDSYRPLRGPEGLTYWLLEHIEGQQVFSTGGRNLVLFRDVRFTGQVINDTGFEALRRQAYASEHSIVRETDAGQRYLEKTPDGGRRVREGLDRDSLFLLGGVFYNRSLDFPIPLAGINYFNRDMFHRDIQANLFYGGVLTFGNLSDPDLLGTGLEGSADLFLQGFSGTDRPVREGEEEDGEGVDTVNQSFDLGLGLPFADHWKVKWTAGVRFAGFARDEDTERGFVIPSDTLVTVVGMEGEFNRQAWRASASIRASDRSTWEPWGFAGNPEYSEDFADFVQYEGNVSKDFFLPLNQKIHAEVSAAGGGDLDRFSKYRFDYFGNRVRGFGGAGLRYTNGAKAQIQYAFNLGNLVRFEATVDHARVKDREDPVEGDTGFRSFTGVGLSGQTIVGPNLILTLDWGIAAASDIDDFRGDQEIFVTILRLFN